jgi:alpha-glucosidase
MAFYTRLLHWRRQQPALMGGSMAMLPAHDQVLAFVREADGQRIVCVFNFSDRAVTWDLPLGIAQTATTLTEGGLTGAVLQDSQVVCEPWGGLWAAY